MKKTTFLIVGKHPVLEALKNPSRKIERVFLTEDAQKRLNRENQSLNLFKSVNIFYKSRKELDNLCGRDETAHQGLVAEVEQLEEITLKEFVLDNKNRNINLIALEEDAAPGQWIESGPHLMRMPADPSTLDGMTTDFASGAPYVMFAGTVYAHVMYPMVGYYDYQPESAPK